MPGLPSLQSYAMPSGQPANTVDWTLDPDRAVLLIHDMQRYFLDPLPTALRDELVLNTALIREHCALLGMPVGYTAQPGRMTDAERGLLKDFWGPGMRTDPAEREIVAELAPAREDWIFTKWRYSAFHRSSLLESIRDAGRDQVLICGVYAHVGILMTAADAFTNDIRPFIVADAVADFSAAHHLMALRYAAERCAMVVTTKEVLA
jgi:isochorismate hydrolase